MHLPPYYLKRPVARLDPRLSAAFERFFAERVVAGNGAFIDYTLSVPKWQFLTYMGDELSVVMHGSGDATIDEFEPRQSDDAVEFGNQRAVYASSDGLWAMYFAIVDRDRHDLSLVNSCVRVHQPGSEPAPHYYFSVSQDALAKNPWRRGTIYVLPKATFEQQEGRSREGVYIEVAQWRSFTPVKPLARIMVEPEDFPFLDDIRGHDSATVRRRALANPDGFPWLDE